MPKYIVSMMNDHELTIEAPHWGAAVETALRHMPGVDVKSYRLANSGGEAQEDATDATDIEETE